MILAFKGLQLIYIPFTVDKFNDEETYHYLHPSAAKGKWKTVDNKISSDFLMQYIVAMTRNIHLGPAFIHYTGKPCDANRMNIVRLRRRHFVYEFSYYPLSTFDFHRCQSVKKKGWYFETECIDCFQIRHVDDNLADVGFDLIAKGLMDSVREKVEKLRRE